MPLKANRKAVIEMKYKRFTHTKLLAALLALSLPLTLAGCGAAQSAAAQSTVAAQSTAVLSTAGSAASAVQTSEAVEDPEGATENYNRFVKPIADHVKLKFQDDYVVSIHFRDGNPWFDIPTKKAGFADWQVEE